MNINYNQKKIQRLNESQQLQSQSISSINDDIDEDYVNKYQQLFKDKSNFFRFSNGIEMADFNANVDIDNKFSLRWHAINSKNLDTFLISVENFIKTPIAESDKLKLTKMYNQLYSE